MESKRFCNCSGCGKPAHTCTVAQGSIDSLRYVTRCYVMLYTKTLEQNVIPASDNLANWVD